MKFVGAWLDGFRRYIQFDGRASRLGFWSFFLGNWVAATVIFLLGYLLDVPFLIWLSGAWAIIAFIPTLAVSVRRLHDHHFSGWWLLVGLTGIGYIVLLIGFALPGDPGPNRYGAQPGHRANTANNLGAA